MALRNVTVLSYPDGYKRFRLIDIPRTHKLRDATEAEMEMEELARQLQGRSEYFSEGYQ